MFFAWSRTWFVPGRLQQTYKEISLVVFFMYGSPVWPSIFREKSYKKTHLQRYICFALPKQSMYGIFTYIWLIFVVNVGKYTIHGSSGLWTPLHKNCPRLRLREKKHIILIITHGYVDMCMASYPIVASNKRKYMHLSLTIYVQACGYFVYENLWQKMTEPVWTS